MKNLYLLTLFIFSFAKTEAQSNQDLNPAASEILRRINFIENQFKEYKNGNYVRFYYANGISLLSGLEPKIGNSDYNGPYYIPDEKEIKLWKAWFDENKYNFSFVNNNDSEMIYELNNEKIIQIEYEKDKYRFDISEVELEYSREIYSEIKSWKSQK